MVISAIYPLLVVMLTFGNDKADWCRKSFHNSIDQEQALNDFIKMNKGTKTALVQAYVGAATTIKAEYTSFPNRKYSYFNQGKDIVEQSVKDAPENPEIRYLRLLVQLKAPSFLLYNGDIEEDLQSFERNIVTYGITSSWKRKMIDYLIKTNELSSKQKKTLNQLKFKV